MARRYFKRYRMEIDLHRAPLPGLPPLGFGFLPWSLNLVEVHAEVKYRSFLDSMDAQVFPCLADFGGCRDLMRDISDSRDFLPAATWLAVAHGPQGPKYCGTIQGVRGAHWSIGRIQNVGVLSEFRGRGLGGQLVLRALHGFRLAGLRYGSLEATADNEDAIRLYRHLGFRHTKTLYKMTSPVLIS